MMKHLRLFVFAGMVLGGCTEANADHSAATGATSSAGQSARVDGAEARRLVAAGAVIVDVRTPGEFAGGHVEGARNIPVDEIESRLSEIPREKTVVVYCASGRRSASAAAVLARAGYTVRDMGPFSAWGG